MIHSLRKITKISAFNNEPLPGFFFCNISSSFTNLLYPICFKIDKIRKIFNNYQKTFKNDTKTFAIAIVTDIMKVDDPLDTVKQMVEFSINFADKFHASLCDEERTPITKQMISHMESRAQDVARIKQLSNHNY